MEGLFQWLLWTSNKLSLRICQISNLKNPVFKTVSKALKYISQNIFLKMSFSSQMAGFPSHFTFDSNELKFTESFIVNLLHRWPLLLTVPLFSGEVVCWNIFLCFLSRNRSGGQGSLLSKSAANRTETDATLSCYFNHKCAQSPSFQMQAYNHFRFCTLTECTCSLL